MKPNLVFKFTLIAGVSVWTSLASSSQAATLYLDKTFYDESDPSANTPPDGTPPWLTITTNASQITFQANLSAGEYIQNVYLNFAGDPLDINGLQITPVNNTMPTPLIFSNGYRADGSGNYDIMFSFSQSGAGRFILDQKVEYTISYTGSGTLSDNWNLALSENPTSGKAFSAAAKVGGTGTGNDDGSAWIGTTAVPEPSAAVLSLLASVLLVTRRRP